jgi:hypothetical protein
LRGALSLDLHTQQIRTQPGSMFSARSTKADAIPTVLPWVEK